MDPCEADDNGIIATGSCCYDLHLRLLRIARDSSEAAKDYILHQVPS